MEHDELRCKFCGAEAEVYYFDREFEFIGCECCVHKKEWYDVRPEDIQ